MVCAVLFRLFGTVGFPLDGLPVGCLHRLPDTTRAVTRRQHRLSPLTVDATVCASAILRLMRPFYACEPGESKLLCMA